MEKDSQPTQRPPEQTDTGSSAEKDVQTGEESREPTEKDAKPPGEKVEVVHTSQVLFAEQQSIIKSLEQELEESRKKGLELQDSLRRLAADFDNYKKWAAKERQIIERKAAESLIKKLLDIYESLEKAACTGTDVSGNEFIRGIQLIYKEFTRVLQSEGLEPIPTLNTPLDVYRHEVLMQKINNDVPENTVLEEIQKGYLLNALVLRPAKVVVSQTSSEENIQQEENQEEEKGE
ncbi:MAG: nucleotide exchange factor GrpE [Candidatus Brocadiaceae bacterium]|nr:nucleotide exchange factor GrpE [Candidatus Brocadiaceae bacterium]